MSVKNWKYWRNAIGFFVLAATAGVGIVAVGIYGEGFQKDDDKKNLYILGGALAATAVLGTFIENHMAERARSEARDRAIEAEARMAEFYKGLLAPMLKITKEQVSAYVTLAPRPIPAGPMTLMEFDTLLAGVLERTVQLISPPAATPSRYRARAAYFEKSPTGDYILKASYPPDPSRTPRDKWLSSQPQAAHISSDILGSTPKTWVVDGTPTNISYMRPTSHSNYEAVIAAPVAAGGRLFGMLSVDVPSASDFIPDHEHLITALGDVLAANLLLVHN
ncbi:GAF domain-containing protein [Nocardia asteroides]|uniref:GAF domain-containing protein n=1 Tax=Nocardia asteroides TaxID=1824 RepID=UPI001E28DE0B|nr:GAF domain-containing protein [Nocardia asteroides]UGT63989.1 hypothetical protein LTT61_12065 [Nocardia asteroides]